VVVGGYIGCPTMTGAKSMQKADGAWVFDHAMPPIKRHTERSHREPHGWYVDTRKKMLGATSRRTAADVQLHQVQSRL
jgi:hypothetical protein